jgi:hypothetical protein
MCLDGTRVKLLEEIEAWVEDPHDRCIFWLNGMAGTGKSTIARTIARKFDAKGCLGASFFFSRDSDDLNNADKFFTTLAFQLARVSSDLKGYICDAITKYQDIHQLMLHDQWKRLIFQPLLMLKNSSLRSSILTFVIDALDECDGDDIRKILRIVTEAEDLKTVQLRVFITSRPEILVRSGFDEIIHRDLELQNVSRSIIEQDIALFLRNELRKIRKDWPSEQNINILAQRADCLFIYAATVCRFIAQSRSPERRLSRLLSDDTADRSPIRALDKIYTKVLERSTLRDPDEDDSDYDEDDEYLTGLFKHIVGSIIVLFDPLSVTALTNLLPVSSNQMKETLEPLYSLLNVSQNESSPIRLLHLSFRDFLLNNERCLNKRFWVDEKKAHSDLAENCLRAMSNTLKRDICSLHRPGILAREIGDSVDQCLPTHVQYACHYWVRHLEKSDMDVCDYGSVHNFLRKHFLHWLEALSLMGKMSEGVLMITALQSVLTVSDFVPLRYDLRH